MKKHGEPLHVQAGMICLCRGHYFPVTRITEIMHIEGNPFQVCVEDCDELFRIDCTLPEFLAAMEEARKQLHSPPTQSVSGGGATLSEDIQEFLEACAYEGSDIIPIRKTAKRLLENWSKA